MAKAILANLTVNERCVVAYDEIANQLNLEIEGLTSYRAIPIRQSELTDRERREFALLANDFMQQRPENVFVLLAEVEALQEPGSALSGERPTIIPTLARQAELNVEQSRMQNFDYQLERVPSARDYIDAICTREQRPVTPREFGFIWLTKYGQLSDIRRSEDGLITAEGQLLSLMQAADGLEQARQALSDDKRQHPQVDLRAYEQELAAREQRLAIRFGVFVLDNPHLRIQAALLDINGALNGVSHLQASHAPVSIRELVSAWQEREGEGSPRRDALLQALRDGHIAPSFTPFDNTITERVVKLVAEVEMLRYIADGHRENRALRIAALTEQPGTPDFFHAVGRDPLERTLDWLRERCLTSSEELGRTLDTDKRRTAEQYIFEKLKLAPSDITPYFPPSDQLAMQLKESAPVTQQPVR